MDQTVMLYPLDGCDTRAPLGANFRPRPDGAWTVARVEPRSFAAAMGLLPADVLVQVGIGWGKDSKTYYNTPSEIDQFFGLLPRLEPYLYTIGIKVRRTVLIPTLGFITYEVALPTTRRNNPALALFLGTDREWVLWTPQGYYDTSIEGDARFLGWHINPPFRSSRPTDFVPIGTFADAMNRRDVLDRLWTTGVLDRVATAPAPAPRQAPAPEAGVRPPTVVAVEDQPPQILFASVQGGLKTPAPGVLWEVDRPDVRLELRISASGKSEIGRRRIFLDERPMPRDPNIEPRSEVKEEVPLNGLVPNRRVRLAVEATNVAGGHRTETIDIIYRPPAKAVATLAARAPTVPAGHRLRPVRRRPSSRGVCRPRCQGPGRLARRPPDLRRWGQDGISVGPGSRRSRGLGPFDRRGLRSPPQAGSG